MVDVCKRFGDNQVLDHVNLEIAEGTNFVLIGSAAAGKSVLLKCILGLFTPESGRIEIDGVDTIRMGARDRDRVNDRIGTLFQQNALFDSLTIWENIAFKLTHVRGIGGKEAKEMAIERMSHVGLAPLTADLFPADLSGGMQKRAGLARAIADEPEILLLDSPTAGLDPILANQINILIRDLVHELGATALCITSEMDSVRDFYDEVTMIHEGKIVWNGPSAGIDAVENDYLQQLLNGRKEGPIAMPLHAPPE